MSQDQAEWECW